MKYIFLDMDGVVVTNRSNVGYQGIQSRADPCAVDMINQLCANAGAKIVVSSMWRKHFDEPAMFQILKAMGFREEHLLWPGDFYTVALYNSIRGIEINEWLSRHPEATHYVILDDNSDMLPSQDDHFVKTHSENGLGYRDYLRARAILSGPPLNTA